MRIVVIGTPKVELKGVDKEEGTIPMTGEGTTIKT